MTWQLFRCNGPGANGPSDNCTDPLSTYCISDALIRGQAAAMHSRGFAAAGYVTLSIDDCEGTPARTPSCRRNSRRKRALTARAPHNTSPMPHLNAPPEQAG